MSADGSSPATLTSQFGSDTAKQPAPQAGTRLTDDDILSKDLLDQLIVNERRHFHIPCDCITFCLS